MKKLTILVLLVLLCQLIIFSGDTDSLIKSNKKTILETAKVWQENYNNFKPDTEFIKVLNEKIENMLRIDIYLGIWCGDSENNVPKFMKILNGLDKTIEINYYLCERKKDKTIKYFVEDKNIIKVPTFVFYSKNVEIGRIIENPNKSLLEDFLEIVF